MKIFGFLLLFVATLFGGTNYPATLYDKVIVTDAKNTYECSLELLETLQTGVNSKVAFEKLALNFKKVQALYIAGELDESGADLLYEIDIYHNAKENIYEQLDRIITSKEEPKKAMFKNSHKTLNALEYLIFKKPVATEKELEMARFSAKAVSLKLQKILQIYQTKREQIIKDEAKFNALLLNQLGASSYELKEWRAGEATGFSKKYKNKPDIKRAEFFMSGLSVKAIIAILETHKKVIDDSGLDFGDKSIEYGAKNEVELLRTSLSSALKKATAMNNNLLANNGKSLYNDLGKLHNGYYVSLISALRMTSKILDADGD